MSLWYENLALTLYDYDHDPAEKARCILAYLSMPIPRSWWEKALKTGHVQSSWANILSDLQVELSKSVVFHEQLKLDLLVALAFIDDDKPGNTSNRFGDINSRYALDEYITEAKKVLKKRPELVQVGSLVEKAIAKEH